MNTDEENRRNKHASAVKLQSESKGTNVRDPDDFEFWHHNQLKTSQSTTTIMIIDLWTSEGFACVVLSGGDF